MDLPALDMVHYRRKPKTLRYESFVQYVMFRSLLGSLGTQGLDECPPVTRTTSAQMLALSSVVPANECFFASSYFARRKL